MSYNHDPTRLFNGFYYLRMAVIFIIDCTQLLITEIADKGLFIRCNIALIQEYRGNMRPTNIPAMGHSSNFVNIQLRTCARKLPNNPLAAIEPRMVMIANQLLYEVMIRIEAVGQQVAFAPVKGTGHLNSRKQLNLIHIADNLLGFPETF